MNFSDTQINENGKIISYSSHIEALLQDLGASEQGGIHSKTEELKDILPAETARQLHFLGTVRNKVAHPSKDYTRLSHFEQFEASCKKMIQELNELKERQPEEKAVEKVENERPEEIVEILEKCRKFLDICAFIPGVNTIFFAGLILEGFAAGLNAILLITFWLLSIPLIVKGIIDKQKYVAIAGIVLFFIVYGFGIKLGRDFKKEHEGSKLYLVPVLNIFYFFLHLGKAASWRLITGGIILLGLTGFSIFLFKINNITEAVVVLVLAYLGGIVAMLCGKKRPELEEQLAESE
jgi:hypothetical protein